MTTAKVIEQLKELYDGLLAGDYGLNEEDVKPIEDAIKILEDTQPVKRGYWSAENERPKSVMYRCSVCGEIAHDKPFGSARHYIKKKCALAYCPHCGVKMDGGTSNENN